MKTEQCRESAAAPSLTRRAAYTLAAAAAASGVTSDADAAIAYYNPEPDLVVPLTEFPNQQSYFLDINNDSLADVRFDNFDFFGGNYQALYVQYFPGKAVGFFGSFPYVTALSAGASIDSTTTSGGPFDAVLSYPPNPQSQFATANGAFIGLGFPIGPTDVYYAWVRVDINNGAGTFTIRDYAFNTDAFTPIKAGQTPEPGTLGMLAAGALGLLGMRRKRQAAAAPN
jgi:hypothetical protein